MSWIDGAPLLSKSELLQTLNSEDGLSGFVNDLELQEEGSDGRPCGFSRLIGSYGFGGLTGFTGLPDLAGFTGLAG